MKKSKYNFFEHCRNFHIGVNLLSGQKIVLLDDEYLDFTSMEADKLHERNVDLFATLQSAGFITEDTVDEFARLLHKRNQDVFYNNNIYRLTILPTLECNFHCWYCYEKHPKGQITSEMLVKIKKYIEYVFNNIPIYKFQLDWFGGEPLLYFDEIIYPLSQYVLELADRSNIQFSNSITTNGYLIQQDTLDRLKEINLTSYQITLDGYRETHNRIRFPNKKEGSYDTIVGNINRICSSIPNACITLRINYTNATIKDIGKIVDDIHLDNRHQIAISLQRVWQTVGKESNNTSIEKEIEDLQNKGCRVFHDVCVYGRGCICYSDSVNQCVINYDGALFKCTARDFTNKNYSIGHLQENGQPYWNENYYRHFLNSPFDNEICKICEYVPICLGVCSQKYIETAGNFHARYCNKENCRISIKNDLENSLYAYIKQQLSNQNQVL